MSSISERSSSSDQTRTYERERSVVFLKTHEAFGGLSNMAGGFPLHVQGTRIYTSEALYQACRFPHLPEVQRLIIGQASPMTAKMKSKPHRKDSRADWDRVRVKVMRWCLRVKLAQNWETFSELLLKTGNRPIVEESRKDDFWGAKPVDDQRLIGMNVLGRLLMELREAVRSQGREPFEVVQPPAIPDFLLFGRQIDPVCVSTSVQRSGATVNEPPEAPESVQKQASLFKVPVAREVPPTSYGADEHNHRGPLRELMPYPTMKDSGVSWVGDVPMHWERRRLKSLLIPIDRRSSTGMETLLSLRRDHGIVVYSEHFSRPAQGATTVGYKIVNKGQLVVNRLQANNGLVFDSSLDGLVSPDYSVFESRHSAPIMMPYLSLLLRTHLYRNHFRRESTGLGTGSAGFLRLYDDRFLETAVVVPPPDEQASILRFIDHADRRIRRYIRVKQKLIKLLFEQTQAIIHRTISRGLDPNVRLKPSGVEWLGDVPKHWVVKRLRHLIEGKLCYGANVPAEHTNSEWPRYLRITDFAIDGSLKAETFRSLPPEVARDHLVEPGDLLLARSGATVGKAFLVPKSLGIACHAGYLIRARPRRKLVSPEFLFAFTQSAGFARWKDSTFIIATIQNIGADKYADLPVPLPPLSEQLAIVDYLTARTEALRVASGRASREIALVREFRARLVADAVTGKLDVRQVTTRLPHDEGDAEPRDEFDAEIEGGTSDQDDPSIGEEIEA